MNAPDSDPLPPPSPPAPEPSPAPAGAGSVPAGAEPVAGEAAAGEVPPAGGAPADGGAPGERRRRRRRRRRGGGGGGGAEGGAPQPGDAAAPAPAAAPPRHGGGPRPPQGPRGPRPAHGGHGGHGGPPGRGPRERSRDSAHAAMQAVQALAEMAHALLRVEGVDPLAMPRYLDLQLRVPLDGGNDVRHAAGTAVEQILKRVREVREHERALRPGAVFDYHADAAQGGTVRPTEPRQVFDGYSATGKPQFTDFVTLAIERKNPDLERLLAGEDVVLTHVTMGRVLRTQQLAEFGGNSPVYKILGQVDAGLFRVLGAAGKCAFSFQLLRGTTLEGRIRLRLHTVGAVDPIELADPAVLQILSRFQRRLDVEAMRLQGQSQHGEVDEESFVLPLLNDLARQLQGRSRTVGRRTQHGLERSEAGQRPTSRAYPDAGEASDEAILWDVDQATVVVLGGKGRVHVFTPQGKHVTSVTMPGQAVERRRHTGRWRAAEPEERGEFRVHIKRLVAAGQDVPQDDAAPLPGAPQPPA